MSRRAEDSTHLCMRGRGAVGGCMAAKRVGRGVGTGGGVDVSGDRGTSLGLQKPARGGSHTSSEEQLGLGDLSSSPARDSDLGGSACPFPTPPGLSFPRYRESTQVTLFMGTRPPRAPPPKQCSRQSQPPGPHSDAPKAAHGPQGTRDQAPEGAGPSPHLHCMHHGLGLLSCGAVTGRGGRGQLGHGAARALWEGITRLSSA